ncbi:solanesyl diphosphate synthase 3, chloroplastic/mitochondrial isoform X2 [Tanacetum coccineum]
MTTTITPLITVVQTTTTPSSPWQHLDTRLPISCKLYIIAYSDYLLIYEYLCLTPACRAPYDKDKIVGLGSNFQRVAANSSSHKQKQPKPKQKTNEGRKDLSSVRVIQRKIAYIIGLPLSLADEDIYITYSKEEKAVRYIHSVHGYVLDGRYLRQSIIRNSKIQSCMVKEYASRAQNVRPPGFSKPPHGFPSGTTTEQVVSASMDYYLQKTYYKTASLISNSCKSIALLTDQTAEVTMLAYEYRKNLGLVFQLIDDVLDFTGTSSSLGKGSLSDIRHAINTLP